MKKIRLIAAVAPLLVAGFLHAAKTKASPAPPKEDIVHEGGSVEGEVIDTACYMKMGASGKSHVECARKCAESGVPLGLLTKDGDVYFVLKEEGSANEELLSLVGQTVRVVGKVYQKGGSRAVMMESVQALP